jgi:acetoin utilization protein AcuB
VVDALPSLFWVMTIGMANDVPADIADRVIAKQVLFCCGKPLVFCCQGISAAMMTGGCPAPNFTGGRMLVRDRMTPDPICGRPEMPVTEAQTVMRKKNIRHLPIVDEEKKLVGLITQRSLSRALPSDVSSFSRFEIDYILAKIKVRDVMTRDVVTIDKDMAIEEAARIMADERIGCLPVMRAGDLVGIITDNDLFTIMVDLLGARRAGVRLTVLQPDRPGEVARLSTAIAEAGGNLTVSVGCPAPDPAIWTSVLKVTNIPRQDLVEIVGKLEDVQIQDVREM